MQILTLNIVVMKTSWLVSGTATRVGEERMGISRHNMMNKLRHKSHHRLHLRKHYFIDCVWPSTL